jgi:uncharacterized UPF0146 family protein
VLDRHDRLLEVGIGRRTSVAAALADRGVAVTAIDVEPRSVPDGVDFAIEDVTDLDPTRYAAVDAIYAVRLPPELQRPADRLAAEASVPLYFTTLGGDPAVIDAAARSVRSGTLFVREPDRGP